MGLPVDAGHYDGVINEGRPYEIKGGTVIKPIQTSYMPRTGASMTMRVIHTLMKGYGRRGWQKSKFSAVCRLTFE